jgi:hypothetical protein
MNVYECKVCNRIVWDEPIVRCGLTGIESLDDGTWPVTNDCGFHLGQDKGYIIYEAADLTPAFKTSFRALKEI